MKKIIFAMFISLGMWYAAQALMKTDSDPRFFPISFQSIPHVIFFQTSAAVPKVGESHFLQRKQRKEHCEKGVCFFARLAKGASVRTLAYFVC